MAHQTVFVCVLCFVTCEALLRRSEWGEATRINAAEDPSEREQHSKFVPLNDTFKTLEAALRDGVSEKCEDNCNNYWSEEWGQKCTWFLKCSGCPACTKQPPKTVCGGWCKGFKADGGWAQKCTWPNYCDGCSECQSVGPLCGNWCAGNAKSWDEKCKMESTCDGCDSCEQTPSPTPAPQPTPAPAPKMPAGAITGLLVTQNSCPSGGWTRVSTVGSLNGDLNQGAGGKDIFLCQHNGGPDDRVITDITLTSCYWGGCDCPGGFTRIQQRNLNGDLNQGAGGKYIYMCEKRGGNDVAIDVKLSESGTCPTFFARIGQTNGANGDLNQGAGGKDIFLCQRKAPIVNIGIPPVKASYSTMASACVDIRGGNTRFVYKAKSMVYAGSWSYNEADCSNYGSTVLQCYLSADCMGVSWVRGKNTCWRIKRGKLGTVGDKPDWDVCMKSGTDLDGRAWS